MGSMVGVLKVAANRAGVTLVEYQSALESGLKWCSLCRQFHPICEFKADASRYDGLEPKCWKSRNSRARQVYVSVPRQRGRRMVPARNGDKEQARARVNNLVLVGLLTDPNNLPCHDCGHEHKVGERRHEYDHYLGYEAEHHEHVQAVCTTCHSKREMEKRRAK